MKKKNLTTIIAIYIMALVGLFPFILNHFNSINKDNLTENLFDITGRWESTANITLVNIPSDYNSIPILLYSRTDNIQTSEEREIAELKYRIEKLKHDIWHYEIDRDKYKELSEKYWQELLDARIYIVDYELEGASGTIKSYKKVR